MKRKSILFIFFAALMLITACSKNNISSGNQISANQSLGNQIQQQMDLGNRYLIEGKYEEAIAAFQKVIELDAKYVEAYRVLGQVYQKQAELAIGENGQNGLEYYRLAAEMYEMVMKLLPSDETVPERLLAIYTELGDTKRQLEILNIQKQYGQESMETIEMYAELIERIAELCENEEREAVFTVLEGETFQNFQKFIGEQNEMVFKFGVGKGVGFYSDGDVYYGDYNSDNIREGEGKWIHGRVGYHYLAQGTWKSDLPNGHFEELIWINETFWTSFEHNTGEVIDGLWNGTVWQDFNYYDSERGEYDEGTWCASFSNGKYDILRADVMGDGEIVYIIYEDENGVARAMEEEDLDAIAGIDGFLPEEECGVFF